MKYRILTICICLVFSNISISNAQVSVFHKQAQVKASDGTVYFRTPNSSRVNNIKGKLGTQPELTSRPFPDTDKYKWTNHFDEKEFNTILNEGFSKTRLLQISAQGRLMFIGWSDRNGNIIEVSAFIGENSTLTADELRKIEKGFLLMSIQFTKPNMRGGSRNFSSADSIPEFEGINYFPVVTFITFKKAHKAIKVAGRSGIGTVGNSNWIDGTLPSPKE